MNGVFLIHTKHVDMVNQVTFKVKVLILIKLLNIYHEK
jgi:hypothetical protein